MSKEQDTLFFRNVAGVMGALIAAVLVFFLVARAIGEGHYAAAPTSKEAKAEIAKAVDETIKPVGKVKVASVTDVREENMISEDLLGSPAPQAVALTEEGKKIYDKACVACHGAGVAGAPKLGDAAAWAPRINQGMDVLYEHAIKGFQGSTGLMPPKGGFTDLSDEEVKTAVSYMVDQAQ
ncbi:MAG: c-type cytochrome [Gammaproteobacteria bacterium]|nr:c-type cytochrome [Gammaproteobacteria bacterium]